jgi:hypothetical protein
MLPPPIVMEESLKKKFFVTLGLIVSLLMTPVALPTVAIAQSVSITIGTNLNRGRGITCSQGERLLRNRGFRFDSLLEA